MMKRKYYLILFGLCLMLFCVPDSVECIADTASGNTVFSAESRQELMLVPCGDAIGIKIETEGVMVVEINSNSANSPALAPGDMIIRADGQDINNTDELREIVSGCNGKELSFEIKRDGKLQSITVTPTKNPVDNSYYIGAWVRDSTAGIGTMTWFDPSTGKYGALGHSINDVDTGEIMDVSMGEIVRADIIGADTGKEGKPGLLIGSFLDRTGSIESNSEYGICGTLDNPGIFSADSAVQVAAASEVIEGKAQMLCCIEGTKPEAFDITIEKLTNSKLFDEKNMIIRIDDQRILSKTGGIVQGMSGSPILQNGKIVGAVTHVFVNDPTRGYGIFIENMLAAARSIEEKNSENF